MNVFSIAKCHVSLRARAPTQELESVEPSARDAQPESTPLSNSPSHMNDAIPTTPPLRESVHTGTA